MDIDLEEEKNLLGDQNNPPSPNISEITSEHYLQKQFLEFRYTRWKHFFSGFFHYTFLTIFIFRSTKIHQNNLEIPQKV